MVLVKTFGGKWRMCIDFTDLNKVCLKDSFPLPTIERLLDAYSSYQVLSFIDAFIGYKKISMNPDDQEKTSFITEEGTNCYKAMPIDLKNAGSTYQKKMSRIF